MSKARDSKKEAKREPAKNMKEKRAAKKEKKIANQRKG
jgi:hypothetical protein